MEAKPAQPLKKTNVQAPKTALLSNRGRQLAWRFAWSTKSAAKSCTRASFSKFAGAMALGTRRRPCWPGGHRIPPGIRSKPWQLQLWMLGQPWLDHAAPVLALPLAVAATAETTLAVAATAETSLPALPGAAFLWGPCALAGIFVAATTETPLLALPGPEFLVPALPGPTFLAS